MAASVSNIHCNFCGLTQPSSQPHCAGCGAALPLHRSLHQADKKLLELATQVNTLLTRENSRVKSLTRVMQIRIGVGMICIGFVLVVLMMVGSHMHSTEFTEAQMMRDNTVQQRYTRALEMELYNASGGMPVVELEP